MDEPKVLVGAPTYKKMRYCNERFINAIKKINYENYDILIVDNSDTQDFFKELEEIKGIKVIKDEPGEKTGYQRIVSSRNIILDYARKNNYDYVLMMDVDVIPPSSIIKELLSRKKDLITGLYYNYFPKKGKFVWMPVCWVLLTEEEFDEFKKQYNIPEHLTREDCPRHLTDEEAKSGKLFETVHPSAGCMLLSRKVFSDPEIKYDLEYRDGKRVKGDDVVFIQKAKKQGFKPNCYSKILCDHLVLEKLEKTEDGKLKHPLYDDEK